MYESIVHILNTCIESVYFSLWEKIKKYRKIMVFSSLIKKYKILLFLDYLNDVKDVFTCSDQRRNNMINFFIGKIHFSF